VDPTLVHLARESLVIVLLVSSPPLLAALAVGLATGILQAATQVQEPTLGIVPRVAAALGALALAAPWIAARTARFAAECLDLALRVGP